MLINNVLKHLDLQMTFFSLLVIYFLAACSGESGGGLGGSGTGSGTDKVVDPEPKVQVSGHAQKGPFSLGSTISVAVLQGHNESGPSQPITTVSNNLGYFQFETSARGLLEVSATGRYFDELSGIESVVDVTLNSVYFLSNDAGTNPHRLNINVLTHLSGERIKYLLSQGEVTFADARVQAENELKTTINQVLDSGSNEPFSNLQLFNSDTADEEGNAYLLATTSVIYQYMLDQIPPGSSNPSEVVNGVLASLSEDFTPDGSLDLHNIIAELKIVAGNLNPAAISSNLNSVFVEGGNVSVSNINLVLDSDDDGVNNYLDPDDDNDGQDDEVDAEPYNAANDGSHSVSPCVSIC